MNGPRVSDCTWWDTEPQEDGAQKTDFHEIKIKVIFASTTDQQERKTFAKNKPEEAAKRDRMGIPEKVFVKYDKGMKMKKQDEKTVYLPK